MCEREGRGSNIVNLYLILLDCLDVLPAGQSHVGTFLLSCSTVHSQ